MLVVGRPDGQVLSFRLVGQPRMALVAAIGDLSGPCAMSETTTAPNLVVRDGCNPNFKLDESYERRWRRKIIKDVRLPASKAQVVGSGTATASTTNCPYCISMAPVEDTRAAL